MRRGSSDAEPPPALVEVAPGCQLCHGTGYEVVEGRGARRCHCKRREIALERFRALVPRHFRHVTFADLRPDAERHSKQPGVVEAIRERPRDKYVFYGDQGSGKTHLMWAMAELAAQEGRPLWAGNAQELLDDAAAEIEASRGGYQHRARLRAAALAEGEWFLGLDELDKPNVNKWTAAKVYEIVDAAYRNDQQIVCCSNLSPEELEDKWEVEGGQYGRSIVRRLLENAWEVELPRESR